MHTLQKLISTTRTALVMGALAGLVQAQYVSYNAGLPPAPANDPATQGWTLVDLTMGGITHGPVSPDGATGFNAWNVDDNFTSQGSLGFESLFPPGTAADIDEEGWQLEVVFRMISGVSSAVAFQYANGNTTSDDQFLITCRIAGGNNLVFNGGTAIVQVNGGFDGEYHKVVLRKDPANVRAQFFFDGVLMGLLERRNANPDAPDEGVKFGAASNTGVGSANFHSVTFFRGLPIGTSYCLALPNSSGNLATIEAFGSTSVMDNSLILSVRGQPANGAGIFYFGAMQNIVPFGGGFRCVGGQVFRYNPVGFADVEGNFVINPDLTVPNSAGNIVGGTTWNFQSWYRDPPTPTGFNLSDGLSISFVP